MQIQRTSTIKTGEILDEEGNKIGEIRFDPNNADNYYKFLDIGQRALKLRDMPTPEAQEGDDGEGIEAAKRSLTQVREVFMSICEDLDSIVGEGTCALFTRNTFNPEAIEPLIAGLSPFFQEVKNQRIDKYARQMR